MLLLIAAFAVAVSAASCSTANITDVKMCDEAKDSQCPEDTPTFTPETEEIIITSKLNNAPEGTKVSFQWRYKEDGGVDIDKVELESKDVATNTLQSSLSKPDAGWPAGDYEVIISLDTDNSEPIHKEFSVK